MEIVPQLVAGKDVRPHLAAVAGLRIGIFKEYPYLYDGSESHGSEMEYLKRYAESPDAFMILAWDGPVKVGPTLDGPTLAGALTGVPLREEGPDMLAPFQDSSWPVDAMFYIGELLFLPPYRGIGLGSRLLGLAEAHVRALSAYDALCCATIDRPDNHPLRPEGYVSIERFLHRHGFSSLPGLIATLRWKEIDGVEHDHGMRFWMKPLE